jgi:hypothetical protein
MSTEISETAWTNYVGATEAKNSSIMEKYRAKESAKPLLIRLCKNSIKITLTKQGNISTVRFISTWTQKR